MAARKIKLLDMTMIMVSFVIGMGIFRTPSKVAASNFDELGFFLCWLAGGLVAFCGALTYAEIGSRLPSTGGYFRIFSYAYHPALAFAVNGIILVSNASSLGGVALIGAEYITPILFPHTENVQQARIFIALACILIFFCVNLLGVVLSARAQSFLMLLKIGLVALLISPLFFAEAAPQLASTSAVPPSFMEYLKGFGVGLVAVSFTYGGYQQTINFGEEVYQPSRTIPRAILIGIVIIVGLYMLINWAYVRVIGFEQLKTAENISAIMAEKVFGSIAGKVLSILLFLGVLAYVNGSLLSNPRVMAAMGEDGALPKIFAYRNPSKNVLVYSLAAFSFIAAFVVFYAEEFDKILSFTIFLDCIGMALSAATIFKIRKQTKYLDGTGIYRMKMYPILPIIFILSYTFVAISIFINTPKIALLGLGILMIFIAIYFMFHHRKNMNSPGDGHSL